MDNRRTLFVRLRPGQRLVVIADRHQHQRRQCCHNRRPRCCGFGFGCGFGLF